MVQTFPGATPFDALVFGVAAITKSLPPGSPATLHCIQLLVQKALMLKPGVSSMPQSANKGAKDADKLGDAEKIQLLLLHLIQRVDLQVCFAIMNYELGRLISFFMCLFGTPLFVCFSLSPWPLSHTSAVSQESSCSKSSDCLSSCNLKLLQKLPIQCKRISFNSLRKASQENVSCCGQMPESSDSI